jgi:hypothetical protein
MGVLNSIVIHSSPAVEFDFAALFVTACDVSLLATFGELRNPIMTPTSSGSKSGLLKKNSESSFESPPIFFPTEISKLHFSY